MFSRLLVFVLSFKVAHAFCDCPENYQIGMQDPATPMMEGMLFFSQFTNVLCYFCWYICILYVILCNLYFS